MAKFNKDEWIVIGISGVTCGGKTTLANRIKEAVVPVYVFHQDKYFYPDDSPKHIKCPSMDHNNYDILSALDMEKMFQDIIDTLNGRDKSHANNLARTAGKKEIKGKKFLIAEGFTALNYKPIMDICNLSAVSGAGTTWSWSTRRARRGACSGCTTRPTRPGTSSAACGPNISSTEPR
ncbi:nicotinamide riboside kinase 1 isoform X3 [Plodia interpunctella]|uniref:nicotinamide riboside kinase 1 isoform X3 n=1 Tax=Plodia interpunctella TaxID=58824 RepID=UPI00236743E8|nr:nicotinamide riboside kinase 1 isoform X3 [Plodia interpunctella]